MFQDDPADPAIKKKKKTQRKAREFP